MTFHWGAGLGQRIKNDKVETRTNRYQKKTKNARKQKKHTHHQKSDNSWKSNKKTDIGRCRYVQWALMRVQQNVWTCMGFILTTEWLLNEFYPTGKVLTISTYFEPVAVFSSPSVFFALNKSATLLLGAVYNASIPAYISNIGAMG